MKQQFLVGAEETFQTYLYEHNRKLVPTSASLTVYRPGGAEKLIDDVSMSVASDGLLSYALTASHNETADENYRAVVSYVYNSKTHSATLFYDVVRSKLVKVITDEDIIAELLIIYPWHIPLDHAPLF